MAASDREAVDVPRPARDRPDLTEGGSTCGDSAYGLVVKLCPDEVPVRLVVTGEIDMETAEPFGAAIRRARASHGPVVVDLRSTRFMGSYGVQTLLVHRQCVREVWVCEPSPPARVLSLLGIADAMVIRTLPSADTGAG